MHIAKIIQFATLFSVLMGGLGLLVAVLIHRVQVKTQIFLALYAQYDELLKNSSARFWLSVPSATQLPERTEDVIISMMRFCTLDFPNLSSVSRTPHTETNVGVDAALR